jgi:hypothetical protein
MWYTIQLIIYSFLIIFICHNIYIFYNDNMVENTFYDTSINDNSNKYIIPINDNSNSDDNVNDINNSQTMKNELQNFLNQHLDKSTTSNSDTFGSTSIDDIPISA